MKWYSDITYYLSTSSQIDDKLNEEMGNGK